MVFNIFNTMTKNKSGERTIAKFRKLKPNIIAIICLFLLAMITIIYAIHTDAQLMREGILAPQSFFSMFFSGIDLMLVPLKTWGVIIACTFLAIIVYLYRRVKLQSQSYSELKDKVSYAMQTKCTQKSICFPFINN